MTRWCASPRIFPRAIRSIDGQGNFGNIDGDGAAAYRYTEARMTDVARLLLDGIDEDAIDFRENYSGDQKEPVVLPAALPNLLANGAQGIAVGMATSIPPHNLAELCDAALHLIAHKNATIDQLLAFAPGPDFPTGGIIVEPKAAIAEAYRTGRGFFRRGRAGRRRREAAARGPSSSPKFPTWCRSRKLIEKIAELLERKTAASSPISATNSPRMSVVIEPRARTVDPEMMMETALPADRAREPRFR